MNVGISLYLKNNKLGNQIIPFDDNFDENMYLLFRKKVFVFMSNEFYNNLNINQQKIVSETIADDSDLEITEMLNNDVMTFLFDEENILEEKTEFIELVNVYLEENKIKRDLYNVVINELKG